jgi:hypothetical protein
VLKSTLTLSINSIFCTFSKVNAKFRICQTSLYQKPKYCVCGLYIRVKNNDPKTAFIDFCDSYDLNANRTKIQFYDKRSHPKRDYSRLKCNESLTDEENDEDWNEIPTSFKYFKCAKLEGYCEAYAVKRHICRPI